MRKISQWLHDLTCSQNIKGEGSLIIEGVADNTLYRISNNTLVAV